VDAAARLGLSARAGLHTGECDVMGEKVGGATVRLGEAIASCAPPGEALLSSTVKDLVAGSGIEFEPRAARAFTDLPGEWQLFAARIRRPS
jgi:class 3 adenylate cyclase